MAHVAGLSVEEQRKLDKQVGIKGFWILLFVTFAEVGIALFLKDVLPGAVTRLSMIALSLYKAYYIVSIFMHLGEEVGGFASTIVLPMFLLVWGVIAFLWEGDYARGNRNYVTDPRPGKTIEKEPTDATTMNSVDKISQKISFL
ncbi:MAG: cytochrome C oxidase subunit IV family protein [Aureispira sp.]